MSMDSGRCALPPTPFGQVDFPVLFPGSVFFFPGVSGLHFFPGVVFFFQGLPGKSSWHSSFTGLKKKRKISDLPRMSGVVSARLRIQAFRVKLKRTAFGNLEVFLLFEKDLWKLGNSRDFLDMVILRQEAKWIWFGQNFANPNQDRSPATLSVVPVPAARARTDPKAFLASLSKKQRGRNWFKQQSVAVLQDCQGRNFPGGLLDVSQLTVKKTFVSSWRQIKDRKHTDFKTDWFTVD